jgi:hypothetical protein
MDKTLFLVMPISWKDAAQSVEAPSTFAHSKRVGGVYDYLNSNVIILGERSRSCDWAPTPT